MSTQLSSPPGQPQLPQQLLVTLPEFELPDCPDSKLLAGEYVLDLAIVNHDVAAWSVSFEPLCGYFEVIASLSFQERPLLITLTLKGTSGFLQWTAPLSDIKTMSQELLLQSINGSIPQNPLQLPDAGLKALKSDRSQQAMEASSVLPEDCCYGIRDMTVQVRFDGILNNMCNNCTALDGITFSEMSFAYDCEWSKSYGSAFALCDYDPVIPYARFGIWPVGCIVDLNAGFYYSSGAYLLFRGSTTLPKFIGSTRFNINFWQSSGTIFWFWDCSPAWVARATLSPPDNFETLLTGCFATNTPGANPPSNTPGPETQQSFSIDCYPCSEGSCGSNGSSSPNAFGAVCTSSPAPGTGVGGTNTGASNSSGGGQTCSSNIIDEQIASGGNSMDVHKCDCSIRRYYCPESISAPLATRLAHQGTNLSATPVYIYHSVGSNTATLVRNDDNTYTETEEDGTQHDFLATGQIFRIRKTTPQPGIWTIVRDAGPVHIIDPFLRRTTFAYDGNGHLSSIKDPFGRTTNYAYSVDGLLESFTTPELCQTEYLYDNDNQLKTVIAPDGLRTTYGWDNDGRCNRVQAPDGGITTYNYASGSTTVVTDPLGNVTTLLYDGMRNKVGEIKPLGNRYTYIYDRQLLTVTIPPVGGRTTYTYKEFDQNIRRMETEQTSFGRTTYVYDGNQHVATVNPLGERTTLVRDGNAALIAEINPLGARTSYVYNGAGQTIATINPLGQRTTSVYNSLSQVIATIDPLGSRTSYSYANGQRTVTQDPLNRRTTVIYDEMNRVLADVAPTGARTSFLYDTVGRRITTINPAGYRTTSLYDANRLTADIDPFGQRTSFSYNLRGDRIRTTNPLVQINTTLYDPNARPIVQINPLLARVTTIYNGVDNVVATINPLGYRTTNLYDIGNRQIATIDPLGHRTTTIYNANNNVIAEIDALNHRTTTVYDANQQKIATVNALGDRTTSLYNAAGQEVAMVNALNNRYSYTYDAVGRETQRIDPLGRRTTSLYDAAGQKTTRIDAKGARTSYTYNGLNQVLIRQYPDGTRTTFSYDVTGNRTLSENSDIRTTTVYDALNRPLSVTSDMDSAKKTISYAYDPVGNRSQMIDPDGGRFTYSHDANQQLTLIRNPQNERTSFSYDALGRRTLKELANGTRASITYNAANNLTRLANLKSDSTTISSYDYSYNAAGKRTQIIEANGGITTYGYDNIYQLTREQHSTSPSLAALSVNDWSDLSTDGWGQISTTSSGSNYDHQYQYDAVHNRNVKDIDGVRTTSTFDAANQLVYEQIDSSRTTFTFDANGNEILVLKPDGARTTTIWSYENDSIVVATPEKGTQTSVYDPDSLRIKKQDEDEISHFIYDDQAYLLETNESNITVVVYTQEPTEYGYIASQYQFDGSLWVPSYYQQDALGSTMQLTDENEDVTDTYEYDAWGMVLDRTGITENPFQWIGAWGYYKDEKTGLYYVRARDYRAPIGRWTSADPLLFVDGPNLYVMYFVPNAVDPSGTAPIIGGAAFAGCLQAAGYSAVMSWFSGDSLCRGCCKAGVSCLFGAIGGAISGALAQAANPRLASCAYSAGQAVASSTLKNSLCNSVCRGGGNASLTCGIASAIFNSVIGCWIGSRMDAKSENESVRKMVNAVSPALFQLTGHDINGACKLFD